MAAQRWTLIVCPNCELHELPSGAFRARCPGCDTFFSRDDERPADRFDAPENWHRRETHRYPTPGKRVSVVPG